MTAEATLPTAVTVVGGDSVVNHALFLLLRSPRFDAGFVVFDACDVNRVREEADLILVAPWLDE